MATSDFQPEVSNRNKDHGRPARESCPPEMIASTSDDWSRSSDDDGVDGGLGGVCARSRTTQRSQSHQARAYKFGRKRTKRGGEEGARKREKRLGFFLGEEGIGRWQQLRCNVKSVLKVDMEVLEKPPKALPNA